MSRAGARQRPGTAPGGLSEGVDIGQLMSSRRAEAPVAAAPEAVRRPRPGGIACWLYRDIDFGGPRLAVRSETTVLEADGSVLIELDDWWSHNLTAVKPGTMDFWRAQLIPRVDLPVCTVKLPMSMTPPGYNDLIGALRLVR
ncbi:hypothetical protein KIH74_25215 [Kineosporia sp. J2-2]|uniref:Uncharacterized protein n=1 Tax=Kineosporia corallincola TaxID=2835133 RepID=A0ABS5TMN1_9ACTN|nr:hypothetical protein [Kineosporia corallincola]MBT0772270.1 hypothetical protein [Kineosporia corallincola]